MSNRMSRFSAIIKNVEKFTYHILGCGAIGSSAAVQIARSGGKYFKLYDYDIVEEVNIGVSQYTYEHIGTPKVQALAELITQITNGTAKVDLIPGEFENYYPNKKNNIVVLGFDNMDARLNAVTEILKNKIKPDILIDGRMGAETYIQYSYVNPKLSNYKEDWFPDEEGSNEPCNAKATSYCSNMAGAFIANQIKQLTNKQPHRGKFMFNFTAMMLENP